MTVTLIKIPDSLPARIERPPGLPSVIDGLADTLFRVSGTYEELGEDNSVFLLWNGPASEAYRTRAMSVRDDATTMHGGARSVARAVDAYAERLTDLQHESDDILDARTGADHDAAQLQDDVNAAKDVSEAVIAALQGRAIDLASRYRDFGDRYDDLQREVESNDRIMIAAFSDHSSLAAMRRSSSGEEAADDALARPGAPGGGSTPEETRHWWDALSADEQGALIATHPDLIGSTDGLPAGDRDIANRVALDEDLQELRQKVEDGTSTEDERDRLERAETVADALAKADRYLDPRTKEPPGGQLFVYQPDKFGGDGGVAISIGDLDTAEHVATRVPGITNDIMDTGKLTSEATNVYQSARMQGDSSVASMFWLDYDAPDAFYDPATLSEGRADEGGRQLADAIDGLRASRDDPAHLTVIGHSYGSTTVGHANSDHDIDVDDIVAVGSPGMGGNADHASDLNVDEGHVYVGRNSRDPIAMLGGQGGVHLGNVGGGLGNDPSEDDFGGTRFRAEAVDRAGYVGLGDHGKYFSMNSESLDNVGSIVIGQGDQVSTAEHTYDPWLGEPQDPERDRTPESRPMRPLEYES